MIFLSVVRFVTYGDMGPAEQNETPPEVVDLYSARGKCLGLAGERDEVISFESFYLKTGRMLRDMLVVWIFPLDGEHFSVWGWFEGATIYRRVRNHHIMGAFNVEAEYDNCVLLPEEERPVILYSTGEEYSVFTVEYWFQSESSDFGQDALSYIHSYSGENALTKERGLISKWGAVI